MVCPKLLALMSDNDPFRGLDDGGETNRRDWEATVGARVIMRRGKEHFSTPRLDAEDRKVVAEELLGLCTKPESLEGEAGPAAARAKL